MSLQFKAGHFIYKYRRLLRSNGFNELIEVVVKNRSKQQAPDNGLIIVMVDCKRQDIGYTNSMLDLNGPPDIALPFTWRELQTAQMFIVSVSLLPSRSELK